MQTLKQIAARKPPENELLAYKLTGNIWIRKDADGIYEARCGEDICNPFADRVGNYHHGRGVTRLAALMVLDREMKKWRSLLLGD